MNLKAALTIDSFSFRCHLGCSPEEQNLPQEVRASLRLTFESPPLACQSDQLNQTICYARLCAQICDFIKEKRFNTVENLTHAIYHNLQATLPDNVNVWLSIHKVQPPIDNLIKGVRFELGDAP